MTELVLELDEALERLLSYQAILKIGNLVYCGVTHLNRNKYRCHFFLDPQGVLGQNNCLCARDFVLKGNKIIINFPTKGQLDKRIKELEGVEK